MLLFITTLSCVLFFQAKSELPCKGIYSGDDGDVAIFPLDVCMLTGPGESFIRKCTVDHSDVLEVYYSSTDCTGNIQSSNSFDVSKYALDPTAIATFYCNATQTCDYALLTSYTGCKETNDQTVGGQGSLIINECIPLSETIIDSSKYPELNFNESSIQYICDTTTVYAAVYDNPDCSDPIHDLYQTIQSISCTPKNETHFTSSTVECTQIALTSQPTAYPSSVPTGAPTRDCSKPNVPEIGCKWYLDCLEQWKQCGNDGYAIDYGYYYCSRYEQYIDQFSIQGKKWVYQVMECLQNSLTSLISMDPDKTTCEDIHSFAFATHPNCYVDGAISVCAIPEDWWTIIKTVYSGLLSIDGGKQAFDSMFSCANFYKWKGKMILKGQLMKLEDALRESGEEVLDWTYDLFKQHLKESLYEKLFVKEIYAGSVVIEFGIISENNDAVAALRTAFSTLKGTEIIIGNGTNSTALTFTSLELWENYTETTTTTQMASTLSTQEREADDSFMRVCISGFIVSFAMGIVSML